MTYCIVRGCQSSTRKNGRQSGVRLHVFPSCPDRIKLWLQRIGQNIRNLDSFAQRVLDQRKKGIFRICSIHFTPDSYVLDGEKLVLSKDAVPTIFPVRPDHFKEDGTLIQPPKKVCFNYLTHPQSNLPLHSLPQNVQASPLQPNFQTSLVKLDLLVPPPQSSLLVSHSQSDVLLSSPQSDLLLSPTLSDIKTSPPQSDLTSLPLQESSQQSDIQVSAQQFNGQTLGQQSNAEELSQLPGLQVTTQQPTLQIPAPQPSLQLTAPQQTFQLSAPHPPLQFTNQLPTLQLLGQQSAVQLMAQQSALQLLAQQSTLQLMAQQSLLQLMAQHAASQGTGQQANTQAQFQQPVLQSQDIPQMNASQMVPGSMPIMPMRLISTEHGLVLDIDPAGMFMKTRAEMKNTSKKMVDASTSTYEDKKVKKEDKGVQWPEFEFNFEGELWKIEQDHIYPSCFSSSNNDRPSTRHKKDPFDVGSPILTEQDLLLHSGITVRDQHFSFRNSAVKEEKLGLDETVSKKGNKLQTKKPISTERQIETEVARERKFIVFESCLDFLFYKVCCRFGNGCKAPITKIEKYVDGTFLSVNARCQNGHHFHLWHSQPLMGCMAVGNILTAAAVLFSGSNFHKVYEMNNVLGLQQISKSAYDRYQNTFLFPTIDLHWQQERLRLHEVFADTQLTLSGNGHHDGEGRTAKYCTYTFMEAATKRIVDFQIEPVCENTSSVVEKNAFSISLDRLLSNEFNVNTIATNQHSGIKKIMHKKYRHLKHEYDVWNYVKGVKKCFTSGKKKKHSVEFMSWLPAISSHLLWASNTSQGNIVMLHERWRSLLFHATDQHKWKDAKAYHACSHGKLKSNQCRSWLKKGSAEFHMLREVLTNPQITKDLSHMSQICHLEEMEVYNCFLMKYRPKQIHLNINAIEARTKLAALAHNANVHRHPVHTKYLGRGSVGGVRHKLTFPKSKKRCLAKSVYKESFVEHILPMMADVLKIYTGRLNHYWIPRSATIPTSIASKPVPVQLWTVKPNLTFYPVVL